MNSTHRRLFVKQSQPLCLVVFLPQTHKNSSEFLHVYVELSGLVYNKHSSVTVKTLETRMCTRIVSSDYERNQTPLEFSRRVFSLSELTFFIPILLSSIIS